MKKVFSLVLALALALTLLAGCGEPAEPAPAPAEPCDVKVMAMSGPTAMGLSYFMDQAEQGLVTDNNYQFAIAADSDEVVPKMAKGEIDIAAVPANLASVLYNKTEGGVEVLGINTLGVLYIVESGETVQTVEDLRGKTILATGKNRTPEQVLTYILSENGMTIGEDITVEWKSEAAECLSALMAGDNTIAMLPQPFVSAAQMKDDNIRVALDLTSEWDALQAGSDAPSAMVTGVAVCRKEFAEAHPEAVAAFMDHYKESVEYVNTNVEEAAELVDHYGIVKAPVAKKAIPACNIVFIEGSEMQAKLSGYLQVLFDQNPKSVGGKLPGSDFYYAR